MSETTRRRLNNFMTPIVTAVLAVVGTMMANSRSSGALEQRVTSLEHRVDGHDASFQRVVDSISETNNRLGETNTRLGRIEGLLEAMKRK